jgi:AcrR family transcriptional regulator
MGARGSAVADTRSRIVEAAMQLHSERGAAATSWDDIAARAQVHPTTVYRHFRSLAELVPACMGRIWPDGMPDEAEAGAVFAGVDEVGDRFEKLVRNSCHCYGLAPGWLAVTRGEADAAQPLRDAAAQQSRALRNLVRAAVGGRRLAASKLALLQALVDFPFWHSLCQAGLSPTKATDAVVTIVRQQLSDMGLDRGGA